MKTITAIATLLLCVPLLGQAPDRSKLPEHAERIVEQYDEAVQKARDEFLEKVNRERERAIKRLGVQLKIATRRGDFDEAQAIKDFIEALKKETVSTDEVGEVAKIDGLDPQVKAKLQRRVTLVPPYDVDGDKNKLGISTAIHRLAKQVGMKYDFKTSEANTGGDHRLRYPVFFDNVPFADALKKLCGYRGFKVEVVDGDTIVLKK